MRERAREGVLKNVGNNSSRFDRKRVIISMEHLLSTSSKDFSPLFFQSFFIPSSDIRRNSQIATGRYVRKI